MSVPFELLLHPELLTNQQMMSVLQERHLKIPDIPHMTRDQLLEVFHQYCIPYGQRRYRDSGRGKMLNKTRNITETTPEWMKLMTMQSSQNNKTSYKHHAERIKPPPDLLSGHIKRIKISVDIEALDDQRHKRKVDMNTFSSIDLVPPPPKKERKHNVITWP